MANGKKIVHAILRYEEKHGASPGALTDLVGTELEHLPRRLLGSSWGYWHGGTPDFRLWYWIGMRRGYCIDRGLQWSFHDGG